MYLHIHIFILTTFFVKHMQYCHIEYIVYVMVKVYNRTLYYYNAIEGID